MSAHAVSRIGQRQPAGIGLRGVAAMSAALNLARGSVPLGATAMTANGYPDWVVRWWGTMAQHVIFSRRCSSSQAGSTTQSFCNRYCHVDTASHHCPTYLLFDPNMMPMPMPARSQCVDCPTPLKLYRVRPGTLQGKPASVG